MGVKPKEAATVILLRKRGEVPREGFEVLMVRRSAQSKFVPDSYVFPGGALDDGDCSPEAAALCRGLDPSRAFALLQGIGSPSMAMGIWVAGIRETFEEVSLLMVRRDGDDLLAYQGGDAARFEGIRGRLRAGMLTFNDFLRQERLTLATDRLHYFSHWITPWFLPIRYDVRFFVAEAPAGQEARHDGIELTGHVWITPREALGRYRENRFEMVYPTLMTMKALSGFPSVDAVIRSTAGKGIRPESG